MSGRKILIVIAVLILIPASTAYGHKVVENQENHEISSAIDIPDHTLSRVVYDTLHDEPHYYKFVASSGENFFGEIVIPAFDTLTEFEPNFAIISSPDAIRQIQSQVTGSNPPCNLDHTMGTGCFYKVHTNYPYSLPNGLDVIVFENSLDLPSESFYEPFSATSYYQRQTVNFEIPRDDTYYMAVFEKPNSPENSDGRFALAFGTVEDWSPIDFVTTFPYSVISANLFFENYGTALIWILVYALIPIIAIYLITRKVRK